MKDKKPTQSAQRWFPGLAISNAKKYIFSNKIYGSNFTESIRRLLRFEIAEMPTAV